MSVPLRKSERTCCICRSKEEKGTLIRLVAQSGTLVVDFDQRLPGRGGYVHATVECVSRMGQPGRWERALRVGATSLDGAQVSRVVSELLSHVAKTAGVPTGSPAEKGRVGKVRL